MSNLKETITNLSDFIEKILEEALDSYDFSDLTQQQLHYMQVIVRMKNPTLSELATELNLTRPTVTVLVNKLTEKGYVTRVRSNKDRRIMHLHIDKKGTKINSIREFANEKIAEKIKTGLSESEAVILTELLDKIVRNS